jgi:hypothetical protein
MDARRAEHLHQQQRSVLADIAGAISSTAHEALERALTRATALGLDKSHDLSMVAKVVRGKEVLLRLNHGLRRLALAMRDVGEGNGADLVSLCQAIDECRRLAFAPPELGRAVQLRDDMRDNEEAARSAVDRMDADRAVDILEHARALGQTLTCEADIQSLLQLPPRKLIQLRLKAAMQRGDAEGVVSATLDIKRCFFEEHPAASEAFAVGSFFGLRPRDTFSVKMGLRLTELGEGMLQFTTNPLHTSITRLDPGHATVACKSFKHILGYMGDRVYTYPATLAQDIVETGLVGGAGMRDELLIQLTKQLTKNPSDSSRFFGWQLLEICLAAFRPSEHLENHLEWFLREAGDDGRKALELLHLSAWTGGTGKVPSAVRREPPPGVERERKESESF